MPATTARPSTLRRRLGAVAVGASVLAVAFTGTAASAKEIGSGSGTGITTTACSPVTGDSTDTVASASISGSSLNR